MIDIDITKYEKSVINNLDRDNAKKIVSFLISENCDYIEQLLEDYLDIFVFEYEDFVRKYEYLRRILLLNNKKHILIKMCFYFDQ